MERVLIVEDDPDAAEVTCAMFGVLGHACNAAHSGREAIAVARASMPNLVLIDLGMPDADGFEVARQLRADTARAYLVAVTGYTDAHHRGRASEAGFDAYVVKPLCLATIRRMLADARAHAR
jgi:CheY-like chemotaxis protein